MQAGIVRSNLTARLFFSQAHKGTRATATCSQKIFNGRRPPPNQRASWSQSVRPVSTSTSLDLRASQSMANRRHQVVRQRHPAPRMAHRAYIALGSNLGDRVAMIEDALRRMESTRKIRILRTSSLWETKAMYVLDQDKFVNGVCEIETSLSPIELLDQLQSVENEMGRVKIIDKGPRNIDLDILLFDDLTFQNDRLQIPHKLMLEREFVLRPLCDINPTGTLPKHDLLPRNSFRAYLSQLPPAEDPISPLTPLARNQSATPSIPVINAQHSSRDTKVMSILNLTPDSFSDGGKYFDPDPDTLTHTIQSHIKAGAVIIDIGGQSTRPGAAQASGTEEIERVVPAIKHIRSRPELKNVAISVDTYRSSVAREAIQAGADIVNDVSAGMMDSAMLPTVAELGCTVCLMHMRGTPETMNKLASYPDGVVQTVGHELLQRVQAAEAAGIRRWRIILDPGIGFAKSQEHNLQLLRHLDELRSFPGLHGLPWLVGTSRKAFVGKITGVKEAKDRTWGTAATVAAAIQGGADIVRVHDVREMAEVAKMADAIWRV